MNKNVSEIFGYKSSFTEINNIRRNYICPFQENNTPCDPVNKKSNLTDNNGELLLTHQTGARSVNNKPRGSDSYKPTIICPKRFLEFGDNGPIVFEFINQFFFPGKNTTFIPEVGLKQYGQADYMIGILEENQIADYAHCEVQADATTGTRGLVECVKDFYEDKDIDKNYSYGLNTKATIKGFSLQMIDKAYLFQKQEKISIWIMQDNLVDYFTQIYNLNLDIVEDFQGYDENNIFIVNTKLESFNDQKYQLKIKNVLNTSPQKIQSSLSEKDPIPTEDIIHTLNSRLFS